MSKGLKIGLIVIGSIVVVLFVGINLGSWYLARDTCTLDDEELPIMEKNPADEGLDFEKVSVTTEDGFTLYGWFVPSKNGATIMALHGSPGGRQDTLFEAGFLNRHGYGVLMPSFRAHDESDGDKISFGYHEQKDVEAWYDYLISRDVAAENIGVFGESMGGGTAVLYAAAHEEIPVVVTASAFALTPETIIYYMTHEYEWMPRWLASILARFITIWAEQDCDMDTDDIDTEAFIGDISPRPILIIHGGKDDKISPENGHELYAAAGEPKELAFFEKCRHVNFDTCVPKEYEAAVVGFFNRYLLQEE